uniref:Secreted protein n=1 Tax=Caenorhabditis tropicalis TaxID=1561998 RepID=A0A1I7TIG5_9PELO
MTFMLLFQVLLLATAPIVGVASRVECHVVLECDPLTSCYSLKGGFPFVYGNKKEEDWRNGGKKYSMFLARNVETVRCVLLDKYEF